MKKFILFSLISLTPSFVFAQASSPVCSIGTNFKDLVNYISCLIEGSVIPFIFGLAVVAFVWGVVKFLMSAEDETQKSQGKQFMLWGIIALAVMVSIWGLVKLLTNTFGVKYVIPQVQNKSQ
ncbi:MAG: hypothetical protein V4439_00805 [Patescibacteria group bacterium]